MDIVIAEEFDHFVQPVIITAGKHGQARRLGQQPAFPVIQAEAEIMHLVYQGAVGGAHQVAVHLARRRQQVIVYYFYRDGIDFCHLLSSYLR